MKDLKFESNKDRLAHIGLQAISNFHDIYADLRRLKSLGKKLNNEEIVKIAENTILNLDIINNIKNSNSKSSIKEIDVLENVNKCHKYFGGYGNLKKYIEINCVNNFIINCKQYSLLQSIINIIDNAFTHNRKKDVAQYEFYLSKILITIDNNKIIISDDGIGIPDDIKTKIFDLYFSTKGVEEISSSTGGVGLYSVKECLSEFADISVENNTILKGANFVLDFNKK